jgi:glucosamine--fructose-6-phosphate aminotransferase (isomerizing)
MERSILTCTAPRRVSLPLVTELERAIRAQPNELRRVAGLALPARARRLAEATRVWLVGTGTSLHAAELGALMLHRAGVDARACSSMDFARNAPLRGGDAVVVITHTGGTAHARAARRRALDARVETLSITATGVGWDEALETGERERSETYTRSYTAALAVLARIAGELGAAGLGPDALLATADAVEAVLEGGGIDGLPEPARLLVLTGSGPGSVTAREGALKLREAARLIAEGYDAEFLLHGSAVPLGRSDALLVLGGGRDDEGFLPRLAHAARAAGVAVRELDQPAPPDELMAQIPLTVRLQLLALRRAEAGGHDPDEVITGAWDDEELWATGAP